MGPIEVILALVALAAAGGLVYALSVLGKARAQAATAQAELAAMRAERDSVRADLGRLSGELEASRRDEQLRADQLTATKVELAARDQELRAEKTARAEDEEQHVRALQEQREAADRSREELERRLAQAHAQLEEKFKALASDALRRSADDLLKLADERFKQQQQAHASEMSKGKIAVEALVKPIEETLKRTDEKLAEIEKARLSQHASLAEQIGHATRASELLRNEASKLTKALSKPEVRGRYGEIQLRRVAELAGMTNYCDFAEQSTLFDADGNIQRPDLEVRLPNGRVIAVDAKTNTQAYMEAVDATAPEAQSAALDRFAKHVAEQTQALGNKKYWANYDASPEFVVMFVPGDQFVDAALSRRPDLLDIAAQKGVILASPSTLIGLLRAVAVGWREKKVQDQARELFDLGRELHERVSNFYSHARRVGKNLDQAVGSFNDMVGSFESRVTPTLRKFEDAGVKSAKELEPPPEVVTRVRSLMPEGKPLPEIEERSS